jgi:predicted nucleic acid-binding protein
MAWGLPDEHSEYADRVLEQLWHFAAVVPLIWPFEIANTLLVHERRMRIRAEETEDFLARLGALPIVRDSATPPSLEEVVALAQPLQASAYDALYLALASRRGLPIATLDTGLVTAAQRYGVPIFDPR